MSTSPTIAPFPRGTRCTERTPQSLLDVLILARDPADEGLYWDLGFWHSDGYWSSANTGGERVIDAVLWWPLPAERDALAESKTPRTLPAGTGPQWITVDERLPEPGTWVIAAYRNALGKWRQVVGEHIPQFFAELSPDSDVEGDYCEAADLFYARAGWYEQQDNWDDYGYVAIDNGKVTHWQPLPASPEVAA